MAGVAGIVAAQHIIDTGLGSSVLLFMAAATGLGVILLLGLSGNLARSEAEEVVEVGLAVEPEAGDSETPDKDFPVGVQKPSVAFSSKLCTALVLVVSVGKFFLYAAYREDRLFIPELLLVEPIHLAPKLPVGLKKKHHLTRLGNGLREPRTFVIHCRANRKRGEQIQP
ncbi:unnamed protein product [Polarella glacialis]|uniref:Uncharacterized protein n=1 Tax=Polarella glacialis TaxID=89957 RepID=A0A813FCD3_POLGL|nr:unnamed protein product [Polarella glacialis]